MATVFVTGGTGFMGRVVTRELVDSGFSVQVLSRSSKSTEITKELGAQAVYGDLTTEGDWQKAARSADFVVHLAQPAAFGSRITRAKAEAYRKDRLTMDRLLLAPLDPSHTKKIVYVGGTSFYGNLGTSLKDEDATPKPTGWGPYVAPAIQTLDGHLARGLPIVTAFPGSIYGDGSWFREYVLLPLRKGYKLFTITGRSRYGSVIHVRDAARATVYLLDKGEVGKRYFLVDDRPVQWTTFYDAASIAAGRKPGTWKLPPFVLRVLIGNLITESLLSDAVLSNARLKALGFEFEFPTIDEGLPEVIRTARP